MDKGCLTGVLVCCDTTQHYTTIITFSVHRYIFGLSQMSKLNLATGGSPPGIFPPPPGTRCSYKHVLLITVPENCRASPRMQMLFQLFCA